MKTIKNTKVEVKPEVVAPIVKKTTLELTKDEVWAIKQAIEIGNSGFPSGRLKSILGEISKRL